MAVVIKYVVVRNGEEKMTFATKKEADAHDKMLDIADNLYDFLGMCDELEPLNAAPFSDEQREAAALFLSKRADEAINILRGGALKKSQSVKDKADDESEEQKEQIDEPDNTFLESENSDTEDDGKDEAILEEAIPVEKKRGRAKKQ
ncbi:MAG: YebG family protein [Desulfamplus sp.]|nr:YebG family protein [Desulfamplus sp.]